LEPVKRQRFAQTGGQERKVGKKGGEKGSHMLGDLVPLRVDDDAGGTEGRRKKVEDCIRKGSIMRLVKESETVPRHQRGEGNRQEGSPEMSAGCAKHSQGKEKGENHREFRKT